MRGLTVNFSFSGSWRIAMNAASIVVDDAGIDHFCTVHSTKCLILFCTVGFTKCLMLEC